MSKRVIEATDIPQDTVSAQGCYRHGEAWGEERLIVYEGARTACNDGDFTGDFGIGTGRTRCWNVSGNKKVQLTLLLVIGSQAPRHMDELSCIVRCSSGVGLATRA